MEKILQQVSGSEMFSLLDGFSRYNQVLVSKADQLNTTFRTPWGTYAYRKMPFGLINVGATFQRAMDITFRGLISKFVVIYLDDITVFSKNRVDHLTHLRRLFERCRKYGISLNPKKYVFSVTKGKLLGFVVSKQGINIDPECTHAISQISMPHSKNSMPSFLGKINFVSRFIPGFTEIVRPLQKMIKKDVEFKWSVEEKQSFYAILKDIAEAPT